jgi:hypothetical protein
LFKFIIKSYSFKWVVIITIIFIVLGIIASSLFDLAWASRSSIPVINLNDIYKPPLRYDNFTRVNLKIVAKDLLAIEGNKKFRVSEHQKNFDYYDTLKITYPSSSFDNLNKIYLQFENSPTIDSINLVTAKSPEPTIFYKQIFYSSVIVQHINEFSDDPELFRIKPEDLVSSELLSDNDTLITQVLKYFNDHKDSLGLAECGRNSEILRDICFKFSVPCRVIGLQGGDADQTGYYNAIGYPLHVVCEIYSSKYNKWYVIDPTYGFRYKQQNSTDFLNAVEISNMYAFMREGEIYQDSILSTKRSTVGRDYFKYFENVVYKIGKGNKFLQKFLKVFFEKFNYNIYHYSNIYAPTKNGSYYIGIKSFTYFILLLLYINSIMFVVTRRLLSVKKPK